MGYDNIDAVFHTISNRTFLCIKIRSSEEDYSHHCIYHNIYTFIKRYNIKTKYVIYGNFIYHKDKIQPKPYRLAFDINGDMYFIG